MGGGEGREVQCGKEGASKRAGSRLPPSGVACIMQGETGKGLCISTVLCTEY